MLPQLKDYFQVFVANGICLVTGTFSFCGETMYVLEPTEVYLVVWCSLTCWEHSKHAELVGYSSAGVEISSFGLELFVHAEHMGLYPG